MARKKNYLNNRDIMHQIHLSKMSYCQYRDKELDNQEDIILDSVNDIFDSQNVVIGKDENGIEVFGNVPVLQLAREKRSSRLNRINDRKISADDIDITDVVFRIMTSEHIPLVPKKKIKQKRKKIEVVSDLFSEFDSPIIENIPNEIPSDVEMVPMRCRFPPFFHYRLDENNVPVIIGKSHWKGSLDDGEFCMTHGRTNNELAKMYTKLCERYATRSNWRSYTYNDEMRGLALLQLAQVGLQFNESKSQNPFSYFTAIVTNSFTRVLNIEKKNQNIRDDILEDNGLTPSWTRQFQNDNSDQKYLDNPDD